MIAAILTLLFAGVVDGILEGWGFDGRQSFERKYDIDPFAFFGSKSHLQAYSNPNIYNKVFGVFDFYHVFDDLRKGSYILSGIFLVLYVAPDIDANIFVQFIGAFMISAGGKIAGMQWIRN